MELLMNNLSRTDHCLQSRAQTENVMPMVLPPEIFENVVSYLNPFDLQSASIVSKAWNAIAINTAKNKNFYAITHFIQFICQNISQKKYSSQIDELRSITQYNIILNCKNLIEIKDSTIVLKEKIVKVLQNCKHR